MTNTSQQLINFASWLRTERSVVGEDVNISILVAQYLEVCVEAPGPEVRHTTCLRCGLDVEVWLDEDGEVESCRDRGGCFTCSERVFGPARSHVPFLG
ncbi:MAG: hypothetical protein WC054_00035 [Candidatus Nanopelagicales bacterium]